MLLSRVRGCCCAGVVWRHLLATVSAGLVLSGVCASAAFAAEYRFGINAEVSYKESESEVRQRYAPFLQELGKLTGHQFVFHPVYSDKVEAALAGKAYDFLLIHTHAALQAEMAHKFQLVGFTDDRKNNQVYFFVKPDSTLKSLPDVGSARMGVPGLQSWATATAQGALKAGGVTAKPTLVSTRYQDAVPVMLELHAASVGVTRSKKLVDDHVARNAVRVMHVTPAMPLNALIAAPEVPAVTVEAVRDAIAAMAKSKAFDALAFKGLTYSAEQSKTLHDFYR